MIHFLDITVDTSNRRIYKKDKKIQTSSLNFDMLVYLLENPKRIISKEELKENVWIDRVVSDNTVYKQVKRIREDLLTLFTDDELLQTVHGRGIMFAVEVKTDIPSEPSKKSDVKRASIKHASPLRILLFLTLFIFTLILVFYYINSTKEENVKLNQKIERLAIVYKVDGDQNTNINQRSIAQALKAQILIYDQLNVALEKDLSNGETFKQSSTALMQKLGYNNVLNMQVVAHKYGVKAFVYLRQEDSISPLKVFEVASTYELINKVSGWVFEQLQTGVSSSISDMTTSESAFNDYLAAIRMNIENKPNSSIKLLEQAAEKDPKFFRALNRLAGQYMKRGQIEKAFKILDNIDLPQSSNRLNFDILSMRAGCYFYLGNLKLASSTLAKALVYAKKLQDPVIQVKGLINQSYIYSAMFLPNKARNNLEEALLHVDKNYQKSLLANIYTGIFDIYIKSNDTVNALHYAKLAYESAQFADNKRSTNVALSNLASAMLSNAEFINAYNAAQKVVDFSTRSGNQILIGAYALIITIKIDIIYGRFKSARLKLDSLKDQLKNIEKATLIVEYNNIEFTYHLSIGNLLDAAIYLKQSKTLTMKIDNPDAKINYAILEANYKFRTKQGSISLESLNIFDKLIPNSPHFYIKAKLLAHNKQNKEAKFLFEQSMLTYQKLGQNQTLINAINDYLDLMLHQKDTSELVSSWLNKLDSMSPPPYPYLKNKALYQSLMGRSSDAASTMQKLKSVANQWWSEEDEKLLLKYSTSVYQ